ncbi:MAG: isoprenylcysteine carboxylmethyltransferase family protein [Candidatus Omnitrophota bacterium]
MSKYLKYFHESKSSNPSWNIVKTIFQTSIFWTLFLVIIPCVIDKIETFYHLPGFDFYFRPVIAIVIFILASLLGLSSGIVMAVKGEGTPLPLNCTKKLVISGPYQFVRNPMAIAGLCQGLAVGIWFGSWFIGLYVISGMILWNQYVRPIEELDLLNRFGDDYKHYQQKIKCWIPNWKK